MDELISKRVALDALNELDWKYSIINRVDVVGAIKQLSPIQSEPHWIPVTERLPEVKQRVIVQYADGSMAIKRCIDAGHLQWFYTKLGTVAWMPAPEQFKGVTT